MLYSSLICHLYIANFSSAFIRSIYISHFIRYSCDCILIVKSFINCCCLQAIGYTCTKSTAIAIFGAGYDFPPRPAFDLVLLLSLLFSVLRFVKCCLFSVRFIFAMLLLILFQLPLVYFVSSLLEDGQTLFVYHLSK